MNENYIERIMLRDHIEMRIRKMRPRKKNTWERIPFHFTLMITLKIFINQQERFISSNPFCNPVAAKFEAQA